MPLSPARRPLPPASGGGWGKGFVVFRAASPGSDGRLGTAVRAAGLLGPVNVRSWSRRAPMCWVRNLRFAIPGCGAAGALPMLGPPGALEADENSRWDSHKGYYGTYEPL